MATIAERHQALIERDRVVGLEAEADAARAHAERLQAKLDLAQQRLDRKNARIAALVAQVRALETAPQPAGPGRRLARGLARRVRAGR